LAHAACQAVAMMPGGKYNPLFLYGGVGLGKTHLLQATGNAILKNSPRATVVYTTTEDFTNQVVEAIQHQKMEQLRRRYRLVDVLIIDDVQFLANKERTQEEFFHTFNALYEDRKQIIISADRPPQELQLEDRLISRFERGMIADVSAPDYETRLAILSTKAAEYELFLDMPVLQFIAEHVTRNIRELEGILMQAVALYELEQRMPTIKSIAEIMRKLNKDPYIEEEQVGFEKPEVRAATFQDVLESVSRYYSVSVQDMLGASRVREILVPRQIAMFLGKAHLRMSFVKLGEIFSGRDHTTVMNAVEKIEEKMQHDPQMLREIRALEQELKIGGR
jgi:chromosomal replication initiator protein